MDEYFNYIDEENNQIYCLKFKYWVPGIPDKTQALSGLTYILDTKNYYGNGTKSSVSFIDFSLFQRFKK